ncbi:MAG: hypothetical protein HC902_11860 [Calothrix sp. SM1_5_4]|nr:hypothetical protein [Calothrix sp. SM1_5_4]
MDARFEQVDRRFEQIDARFEQQVHMSATADAWTDHIEEIDIAEKSD